MLFNSIDFAVFLPIVFFVYWFVLQKNLKVQNAFLTLASYIFYGWWDWRFLFLIVFSSIIDYAVGRFLQNESNSQNRKLLLWVSIGVNLGFLGFFKYYNFFLDNFVQAFTFFGIEFQSRALNIVLPVGISFYTFQTLSYTIDIYKRKLDATKDFIAFSAFVSFFPQLVAGPIERATNLLPQFYKKREFSYLNAVDGLKQMLWGFFKKIVIADNCAEYANMIFNNSADHNGSTLILGAVFFAFQIYGDFSGYSDIAIGTARLFGFNLMKNFSFPYFSRDIAEFWRRWHISLSTWFRDYVYIPLGGSKGGTWRKVRNTFIIFIVSGFWHGANWTFIVWGALNAIYFLPLLLTNSNRNNIETVAKNKKTPNLKDIFFIFLTFTLTVFAWIFFRADDMSHAISIINSIASTSIINTPYYEFKMALYGALVVFFLLIEWSSRTKDHGLQCFMKGKSRALRWTFYNIIGLLIIIFAGQEQDFIYFQF